jgi:hypothetical protein
MFVWLSPHLTFISLFGVPVIMRVIRRLGLCGFVHFGPLLRLLWFLRDMLWKVATKGQEVPDLLRADFTFPRRHARQADSIEMM